MHDVDDEYEESDVITEIRTPPPTPTDFALRERLEQEKLQRTISSTPPPKPAHIRQQTLNNPSEGISMYIKVGKLFITNSSSNKEFNILWKKSG